MEIAVLFGSFFILLLLSVPVGHAIGISGLLSFLLCTDYSPMVFIKSSLSGTDSFTLLAVPFFMLAGNLMATGGIAKRIVNFADSLLGWMTGPRLPACFSALFPVLPLRQPLPSALS